MKIKLNEQDLKGTYLSNDNCPIARCLKRMGYRDVKVGSYTVIIGSNRYLLQGGGRDNIHRLQKGEDADPIVIEGLSPPYNPIQRLWRRIWK